MAGSDTYKRKCQCVQEPSATMHCEVCLLLVEQRKAPPAPTICDHAKERAEEPANFTARTPPFLFFHHLRSVFYNDLFAFDMDRRRWYRLMLKKANKSKSRGKDKQTIISAAGEDDGSAVRRRQN